MLNNLKFAEIKKNNITGNTSFSDNNRNDREGILEKDIISKKYQSIQSYDRSSCKDVVAKNSYLYCQITDDNNKSNESYREKAKSEHNEN